MKIKFLKPLVLATFFIDSAFGMASSARRFAPSLGSLAQQCALPKFLSRSMSSKPEKSLVPYKQPNALALTSESRLALDRTEEFKKYQTEYSKKQEEARRLSRWNKDLLAKKQLKRDVEDKERWMRVSQDAAEFDRVIAQSLKRSTESAQLYDDTILAMLNSVEKWETIKKDADATFAKRVVLAVLAALGVGGTLVTAATLSVAANILQDMAEEARKADATASGAERANKFVELGL
ncbi:hypothetical protein JST99_04845 [Candidatus Dependentiae bacterium]|nr:hypothetical protein [Candidatus Dependentiae bacterium]MCC7414637.1 hypothetical protein [Campylobacterota bacterium]